MKYLVGTMDQGVVLFPDKAWDGSSEFKFQIHGRSDLDNATNEDDRQRISNSVVTLEGCPVMYRSSAEVVIISFAEAESSAAVMVAQDMLYINSLHESIGLSLELPMILEIDNKSTVDLKNNWNVVEQTCHVDT